MKYEEFKSELDNLLKGTEIEDVMSDVFSCMDESDFYSMRIVDEKVNTWISEQEVIYYSRAIEYLQKNDPSLRNAFAAAEEYGFTLDRLDSEKLATILLQSNMYESWGEVYSDVEELISELNDGEEEEEDEEEDKE